jgi:hypothetical protein
LIGAFLLLSLAPNSGQGSQHEWELLSFEMAGAQAYVRSVSMPEAALRTLVEVRIEYDRPHTFPDTGKQYRSEIENWDLRCAEGKGARGPFMYFEKPGARGAKVTVDFFPQESDYQPSNFVNALCEHLRKTFPQAR